MANKNTALMALVLVIVAAAGVTYLLNAYGVLGAVNQPGGTTVIQTGGNGANALRTCQGINTLSLLLAAKNPLNSSALYEASAFRVIPSSGTTPVATGTGTAGTSLSYATISVPCDLPNFEGSVYAIADSALNSAKDTYTIQGTAGAKTLSVTGGDELRITIRDLTLANTSLVNQLSPSEATATAMSAGDSRTGYLDVNPGDIGFTSYGTNGPDGEGVLWSIDTVDAAAFTDKGIALSSETGGFVLKEIDCSKYQKAASVNSANRCYVSRAITTEDATMRLKWSVRADGGTNPGASSDPVLYIDDLNYVEDADQQIKFGGFNSAGTNQGQSQSVVTFDNS